MDISGIVQAVLQEFDRNRGPQSILFENHIYGILVIQQGLSGETFPDISNLWSQIGIEYGFYEDERAIFEGSAEYRALWTRIFQDIRCCQPAFVDTLQDALFAPLCLKGAIFFAAALNTGELPTSLASYVEGLFVEPEPAHTIVNMEPVPEKVVIHEVPATIRYRYTRGRVRSPIIGQRKFSRTRKAKQVVPVEPTVGKAVHKV